MSVAKKKEFKKVTTHTLQEMKAAGEKISMLTAYDFTMAKILDAAGIDVLLVGDSASNVMHGHETTLPITLDQMIYHAASVVRAVDRALIIVDLPFGTYQGNSKERILSAGIPVMGHLGLTPQSIYKFGTYNVRAKEEIEAAELLENAHILEKTGCFALVLEKIPAALAGKVSAELSIPVIGIGAGNKVDGQVLVSHDMLGMTYEFNPRFLRRYLNLYDQMKSATEKYIHDVKTKDFPNDKEQY